MKDFDFSLVHSSWRPLLQPHIDEIERIITSIDKAKVTPSLSNIFRAFATPLEKVQCVIVGQDPYPTAGFAHGLSFSVPDGIKKIPQSLGNIFRELHSDLGVALPRSGNLSRWSENGVMLLNRVLTTEIGISNAHRNIGWEKITDSVARELGARDVVAILWGKQAQELSPYFNKLIQSAHPSSLSAYRGFFGSRPFSQANLLLTESGREPINWELD